MANEIQLTLRLKAKNGTSFTHDWNPGNLAFTQSVAFGSGGGQALSNTSPETLIISDVASGGWFYARNLSTTETINIGRASGTTMTAMISLLPGEVAIAPLAVTNPSATVGSTNTAYLQFYMLAR